MFARQFVLEKKRLVDEKVVCEKLTPDAELERNPIAAAKDVLL